MIPAGCVLSFMGWTFALVQAATSGLDLGGIAALITSVAGLIAAVAGVIIATRRRDSAIELALTALRQREFELENEIQDQREQRQKPKS